MLKFVAKRVIQAGIVLLILSSITFLLMNLVPGGPFQSDKAVSEQTMASYNERYGLDQPVSVQLERYLTHMIQGDLGVSLKLQKNRPVVEILLDLFPVSLRVGLISLLFAILIGIPAGGISAFRKGKTGTIFGMLTGIGIAVPSFVTAVLLLIFFGVLYPILPTFGLSSAASYLLPCTSLAVYPTCCLAKLSRTAMLEYLRTDAFRATRAKGLTWRRLFFVHALKNAIPPILTYLGPLTASILTGSFAVESVFNIPGLGRYYIQSILNRDYPLIMGTTIFYAAVLLFANLIIDLLYRWVDPRLSGSDGGAVG